LALFSSGSRCIIFSVNGKVGAGKNKIPATPWFCLLKADVTDDQS